MKIKLTIEPQNVVFEEDGSTYLLRAAPTTSKLPLGEIVANGLVGGNFIFGRVELWKIANSPARIEEQLSLSIDFFDRQYDGKAYITAMRTGFDVMSGAEDAANLLIKHKLATEA